MTIYERACTVPKNSSRSTKKFTFTRIRTQTEELHNRTTRHRHTKENWKRTRRLHMNHIRNQKECTACVKGESEQQIHHTTMLGHLIIVHDMQI